MRAEDTLQFMMDFQGNLFYNRQKCLDQLFCTIGNGYSWVDANLLKIVLIQKHCCRDGNWLLQLNTQNQHGVCLNLENGRRYV